MTTKELLQKVTSFANMHLSASRIRNIESQTGAEYIGAAVIETLPNGKQLSGIITEVSWEHSVGLTGDWLVYVKYDDEPFGAWLGREVLTLKDGG